MLHLKNSFGDIRFWLVLFFIARLYAITDPPLEVAHNWRQTTVTMAARNFYETDNSILYPRIDIAGEKSGITGMEFPFLNYLIYLVSVVFGYTHWYGRLINLTISSFGIFYFYKLILKYFDSKTAFNAAIILIFSAWFNYSRKIMPDTFSMSFVIAGIYYGSNYLDRKGSLANLFLFFVCTLIGVLSKLPSGYLLIVFVFFIRNGNISIKIKGTFILVLTAAVALVGMYYFYWVPNLVSVFGFTHFFMGKSIIQGFFETFSNFGQAAEKFYLEALQIFGFCVFAAGIFVAAVKRNKQILCIFGSSFALFLIVIFKAGFVFYHHSYYIIPFVPVMALVSGYAIAQITSGRLATGLLLIIAAENILNKYHDYHISAKNQAILNLEADLDRVSYRKDLVLINSKNLPTPMYFAHRKGWVDSNESISNRGYILALKQKGLKFVIILKKTFGKNIDLDYEVVFENDNYKIYKI